MQVMDEGELGFCNGHIRGEDKHLASETCWRWAHRP